MTKTVLCRWRMILALGLALGSTLVHGETSMAANERYERGYAALAALAPQKARAVQDALAGIAPDLGRFIVEFGYGDIFTRPGLTPAERQVATIAALTALGNAAPQLAFHVEAGLAAGLSPEAIVEIVYVTTVFAGFPAGLNALAVCREVFAAQGVAVTHQPAHPDGETDRRARGLATLATTSREAGERVVASLAGFAPDMADFLLDFSYGDVISRQILSPGQKEIAMIAAATARGTMAPQLAVHVKAARAVGLTREQIVEVIIQMAGYAGFPAAINGMLVARDALAELGE
ncbi:carboxymuconolactone decarboxylase family protein [Solidesulfovibrio sp.]